MGWPPESTAVLAGFTAMNADTRLSLRKNFSDAGNRSSRTDGGNEIVDGAFGVFPRSPWP
jgi:hypothetical protein